MKKAKGSQNDADLNRQKLSVMIVFRSNIWSGIRVLLAGLFIASELVLMFTHELFNMLCNRRHYQKILSFAQLER